MNPLFTSIDAMAEIKAATHAQHISLEARSGILERVRTAQGYAQIIAVLAAMHNRYEPQIAEYAQEFSRFGLFIDRRTKRDLLETDQLMIQERFGINIVANIPIVHSRIDSFAHAVGWLYVFEGSTLGGLIIAQHVHRALNIPTSYYGAYGDRSASMWREFRAFVSAYVAGDDRVLPVIVAGARTAFDVMERALATMDAAQRASG